MSCGRIHLGWASPGVSIVVVRIGGGAVCVFGNKNDGCAMPGAGWAVVVDGDLRSGAGRPSNGLIVSAGAGCFGWNHVQ